MDQEVIEQADLRHGAWLETACAFANGRGGSLLVEVPETRRGKTPLETLEWLPVRLYEELGITCEVSLVMVGGRMGVEAAVLPSAQPVSYEGRFFQRRDGQTSLLVGTDLVRFLRSRGEEEEQQGQLVGEPPGQAGPEPPVVLAQILKKRRGLELPKLG